MDQDLKKKTSWLSLIAEAAGVGGATVSRVALAARDVSGHVRVILQVHDSLGQVVGATSWEGDALDLQSSVLVDVGCDLPGSAVSAWIDDDMTGATSTYALAPSHASHGPLASYALSAQAMKLMLRAPSLPAAVAAAA